MMLRVSADVTADLMIGTGQVGARGDDFRVTTGLVWAPQPAGVGGTRPQRSRRRRHPRLGRRVPRRARGQGRLPGRGRLPRSRQRRRRHPRRAGPVPERARGQGRLPGRATAAPSATTTTTASPTPPTSARTSPRTRTASRTTTAAPTRTTTATASPTTIDKCPNDPETVNGFEDDDGCPDVRATHRSRGAADRIDLKGAPVAFDRQRQADRRRRSTLLDQVAAIIKHAQADDPRRGPRARSARSRPARARSRRRRRRTSTLAQQRAQAILDYLVSQGVPPAAAPGGRHRLGSPARHRDRRPIRSTNASTSSRRSREARREEDPSVAALLVVGRARAGRTRSRSTTSRSRRRHRARATRHGAGRATRRSISPTSCRAPPRA